MTCKRKNLKWAIKELCKQIVFAVSVSLLFFMPGVILGLLFGDVATWIYLGIVFVALLCLTVYTLCDQKSRE